MGDKEKQKKGLAEGGGDPLSLPETDPDFDELKRRLDALSSQDRRRTLGRLSLLYDEDKGNDSLGSLDHSNVTERRSQAVPQQVVFEQSDKKLPRFSGAEKPAHGEVTYRRWQRAAERLVDEESVTEEQAKKAILRSLQGEADDIIELHRKKSVADILDVLDKNYCSTIDGDDLLVEFYQIFQADKQSASDYLSHLFIELGDVVKFKGIKVDDMPKVLLKQFIRGTSDEDMLNKLRLEDKLANPPQFPDLISSVRREESKRTQRRLCLKKQAKVHAATVTSNEPTVDPEKVRLQERLAELEAVVASSSTPPPESTVTPSPQDQEYVLLQQRVASLEKKVRNNSVFCYRCGEDFHVATECENAPNKKLVHEKVEARRRRSQNLNMKKLTQ